jgi:hypothetical protein
MRPGMAKTFSLAFPASTSPECCTDDDRVRIPRARSWLQTLPDASTALERFKHNKGKAVVYLWTAEKAKHGR